MLTSWFVPHRILDFDRSDAVEHRALQTLIALFRGPIVVFDSTVAGDHFLRRALRSDMSGKSDGFYRDLMQCGYIRVAMRTRANIHPRLRETVETFDRLAGPFIPNPTDDDIAAPELEYIESRALKIWFAEEDYTTRYQREVMNLFRTSSAAVSELPKRYRDALVHFIEEKADRGTPVGWHSFRTDELWQYLERYAERWNDGNIRSRYGRFVFKIARGPAITFLPDVLEVDPMYSEEDQHAIDLWRGRDLTTEYLVAERKTPIVRSKAADFVKGLTRLSAADVIALCDSDEHERYRAAVQNSASDFEGHELDRAVAEYRGRIEERIIARGAPDTREETVVNRKTTSIKTIRGEVAFETIKTAFWMLLDSLMFPISLVARPFEATLEADRKRRSEAAAEKRGEREGRRRERQLGLESDELVVKYRLANERKVPVHLIADKLFLTDDDMASPAHRAVDTFVNVSGILGRP